MTTGEAQSRKKLLIWGAALAAAAVVVFAMVAGVLSSNADPVSSSPEGTASSESPSASAVDPSAVDPSAVDPSASASADPTADPTNEPSAEASAPAKSSTGETLQVQTDKIMPAYADVPAQETVTVQGTVTARIVSLTPTTSDGTAPGEVKGPAVAVTVELRNESDQAVDLNTAGAAVLMGDELIPASTLPTQSLAKPFFGTLAPGESAQGVYVFLTPEGSPTNLRIEVSYGDTLPLIAFTATRP